MQNKIKVGIIGFGRMGITHYSIINTHKDVEIVAIADTSKVLLNVLSKYVQGIKVFTNYEELLNLQEIDAVLVCTPPNLHYPIIKVAHQKRKHVFCEKPFTLSYSEALELSKIYVDSQLVNLVGYANRERDVFNEMKKLIIDNVIGSPYYYKAQMMSSAIIKKTTDSSWRDSKNYGGGVVYEMASHLIDITNYFFGEPKVVKNSFLKSIYSHNVEDVMSAAFQYENDLCGELYVNWSDSSFRKPIISLEVLGDKGKIIGDFYGFKVFLNEENPKLKLRKGWTTFNLTDIYKPVPFYVRGNEFTIQLYRFIDLITGNETFNPCTFKEASKVHAVIDSIYKNN